MVVVSRRKSFTTLSRRRVRALGTGCCTDSEETASRETWKERKDRALSRNCFDSAPYSFYLLHERSYDRTFVASYYFFLLFLFPRAITQLGLYFLLFIAKSLHGCPIFDEILRRTRKESLVILIAIIKFLCVIWKNRFVPNSFPYKANAEHTWPFSPMDTLEEFQYQSYCDAMLIEMFFLKFDKPIRSIKFSIEERDRFYARNAP